MLRCVMDKRRTLLWGGGSQARLVAEMLSEQGDDAAIIFDATLAILSFEHKAFFTNNPHELRKHLNDVTHFAVCVGGEHGFARYCTAIRLTELGLRPIDVIHPGAFIEPTARIGCGSQVMPGVVVHKFVEVGDQCILNTNCTIDHECILGNGVHVMGGAVLTGVVRVGDFATIGTNATILPGAVVTKDVAEYAVVAGVPVKMLRKHELAFYTDALDELRRSGQ